MSDRAAFVYSASTVHTIGRTLQVLIARYFQRWWTRYSSRIAIFIHHLHWTPPSVLTVTVTVTVGEIDLCIQSTTLMLPLKGGRGGFCTCCNCPPPAFAGYAYCWRTCFFICNCRCHCLSHPFSIGRGGIKRHTNSKNQKGWYYFCSTLP